VLFAATVLLQGEAGARLNPLKQMEGQTVRPEIIILFDNSGSMCGRDNTSSFDGASSSSDDCSGSLPGWMVAGDGLCAGTETSSPDCDVYRHSPEKCYNATTVPSRVWRAKQALRNVLPGLRKLANFALIRYGHLGMYNYIESKCAQPGGPTNTCTNGTRSTIFLHEWELKSAGSWTGKVWTATDPPTSFTLGTSPNTVTYTLVNTTDFPTLSDDDNSLYRRDTGTGYTYARFPWNGPTYPSGGYTWTYVGSFYWYDAYDDNGTNHVLADYYGPRYYHPTDGWLEYKRYQNKECSVSLQGLGMITSTPDWVVPLLGTDLQSSHDENMGKLLNRLNFRNNGGIASIYGGGTPTVEAMDDILAAWQARAATDTLKDCRQRILLTFSDGQFTTGSPASEVKKLYCEFCNNKADCNSSGANGTNCDPTLSNPITTKVISVLGSSIVPSGDKTLLNETADAGDNGVLDNSATADYAATEADLVENIKKAVQGTASGDFVTAAPGVATSGTTSAEGDWAIVASVEYPGWAGHLRAFDMTQDPPVMMWDAADHLNTRTPYSRDIYTGHPTYNSGTPIEILDASGELTNATNIRSLWKGEVGSTIPDTLTDDQIRDFFRWVYGNGRTHRLAPVLRCVPAFIGSPGSYTLKDHNTFLGTVGAREPLIYITSNEGLIHAFRNGEVADDGGTEVFAYLPAVLLDDLYNLYNSGGQDTSMANFKYILAASPRVHDVYDGTSWSTQLVVAAGPSQRQMIAIDITDPTDCSTKPCTPNDPPVKAVGNLMPDGANSKIVVASNTDTMSGPAYPEAWSTPAMFWEEKSGAAESMMCAGGGYATGTDANYYFRFDQMFGGAPGSNSQDPPGTPLVDYAVVADTAAVLEDTANLSILATYQADLGGRIMRYDKGDIKNPDKDELLAVDASRPFYYNPAVINMGSGLVVLAANSHSADEETPPAAASDKAWLYIMAETGGTVDASNYSFACKVEDLSTCLDNPHGLTLPPADAKPTAAPVILKNDPGSGDQVEAWFTLYKPTTSVAASCASAGGGDSYIVRIVVDPATKTDFRVEEVRAVTGRVGGLALAGGGKNIIHSVSHHGGSGPSGGAAAGHSGKPVDGGAISNLPPRIESWREVR
jgi:hypothetical protein